MHLSARHRIANAQRVLSLAGYPPCEWNVTISERQKQRFCVRLLFSNSLSRDKHALDFIFFVLGTSAFWIQLRGNGFIWNVGTLVRNTFGSLAFWTADIADTPCLCGCTNFSLGLARKIELPLAYKGWTYRIAAASLVLVACNFALAYIALIGGRGASGLPPIICILGATIALFMAEISDWYGRLALLPNARRWSTMLVIALGFVVFWFLYSPIHNRLGFVGAFVVFVFFLIGIRLSARYAARFGSRVV